MIRRSAVFLSSSSFLFRRHRPPITTTTTAFSLSIFPTTTIFNNSTNYRHCSTTTTRTKTKNNNNNQTHHDQIRSSSIRVVEKHDGDGEEEEVEEEEESTSSSSSSSSLFNPLIRSLLRLGEHQNLIRRALRNFHEEQQLFRLARQLLDGHKKRLHHLKELQNTSRFRFLKRLKIKSQIRYTNFVHLYLVRAKIRGWATLFDIGLVMLIVTSILFFFSGMRALSVWIKRIASIEEMTNPLIEAVELLENHGGGGKEAMELRNIISQPPGAGGFPTSSSSS